MKKKYSILKGVIPITLLKNKSTGACTINDVLTVCSDLCNMCNSVVAFD